MLPPLPPLSAGSKRPPVDPPPGLYESSEQETNKLLTLRQDFYEPRKQEKNLKKIFDGKYDSFYGMAAAQAVCPVVDLPFSNARPPMFCRMCSGIGMLYNILA